MDGVGVVVSVMSALPSLLHGAGESGLLLQLADLVLELQDRLLPRQNRDFVGCALGLLTLVAGFLEVRVARIERSASGGGERVNGRGVEPARCSQLECLQAARGLD